MINLIDSTNNPLSVRIFLACCNALSDYFEKYLDWQQKNGYSDKALASKRFFYPEILSNKSRMLNDSHKDQPKLLTPAVIVRLT